MWMFIMTLLTVIVGLLVGFVLFELAGILLSGHADEAGIEWSLIRPAFVREGIARSMAMLRPGLIQPLHRRT